MIGKVKCFIKRKILFSYNFDIKYTNLIFKYLNLYRKNNIASLKIIRLYNKVRKNTSCNIHFKAIVMDGVYIAHPDGIIIGETAQINEGVSIYPQVRILAKIIGDNERWNNGERRHAIIGRNTILGGACTIIGPIIIGKNCIIAAGAIVTKDIPDNSIVYGTNQIKQNNRNNSDILIGNRDLYRLNNHKECFQYE